MSSVSREFQVFVKPVGGCCNLACCYCYYQDRKQPLDRPRASRMSDDLLELYIRQHIEASTERVIDFSWHGGEPMLAGLEFFRKAVAWQKKHRPAGKSIINGIQTNGTLLSDAWARFLKEENFTVGLSLDGPETLHDMYRRDKYHEPSFRRVMKGYERLMKVGIPVEILCVIHNGNAGKPGEVYGFFKAIGAEYITFLPLVEYRPDAPAGVSPQTVRAEVFGKFLISVFDEWMEHDIGKIKIQIIEEALRAAFRQDHTLCILKKTCGGVPVVEMNGDFYSCDHFVNKRNLIGNIRETHLSVLLDHPRQTAFGKAKNNTLPGCCLACEVFVMCHGECPKNRFIESPDGEPGLNYLCEGYKMFFRHCLPLIEEVGRVWEITR